MPRRCKNDEKLKKVIAEVTPQMLVDAIDEMLLLQLGKEKGYHLTDEQFKGWLDNIRKDQNLEDEQKFQAGARAGRHDDGRPAARTREQVIVSRCSGTRSDRSCRSPRKKRAVLPDAPEEFAEPATVTLREILDRGADGDQGRQAASTWRPRTRREGEGGRAPRAHAGGEDFAKVAAEVSAVAVEGQRRPDRSDHRAASSRPRCRSCSTR